MIREKMYKQVQTFKRQGLSKKEIAAAMEMDPKTVAKYYGMDERQYKSYRKRHMFRDKLLSDYERDILEVSPSSKRPMPKPCWRKRSARGGESAWRLQPL